MKQIESMKKEPKDLVHVLRGTDPYSTARQVLHNFPIRSLTGRKVLIKPNAARVAVPGHGVTTHPLVVRAAVEWAKELGASRIAIGESCIFGVEAEEAFRVTGMKGVAAKEDVELLNLDQGRPLDLAVPGGKLIRKIKVSGFLQEFDFILSVPVMKTHMHTQVTLSLKNMKGILWRKEKARFHHLMGDPEVTRGYKELDIAISEMVSVLFPHLSLIDGSTGMEGLGPGYGRAKEAGIMIVGNNGLSADAVAARLMGLDPEKVPHLKLSAKKGLGEIQTQKLSVQPEDYLKWETPFEPPPRELAIPYPDVRVYDQGSCSACLATLLVFLQNYYSGLSDYRLEDRKIHIGIGKRLKACPKGTILIGNCTARIKGKCIFIQGCPPVASEIWNTLTKNVSGNNIS
jgi:uncharacterized protein (DUF362 family)